MVLGVFVFYGHGLAASPLPQISALPSPAPSPSLTAPEKLSADEAKTMAREFGKAQSAELEGLKHRQALELRELKASQSAHYKEWNKREIENRHKFMAEHQGAEVRAYIKDFIARREALLRIQKDEKTQRVREQEVHLKALKDDQAAKLKEFRECLSRGERPPASLWPAGAF